MDLKKKDEEAMTGLLWFTIGTMTGTCEFRDEP
jgi:hypothetical protein